MHSKSALKMQRGECLQYIKLNRKTLFDWGTSRRRELGKQFCKLNQLKQIHFCVSVPVKVRDHFHNSYMQISCYSPISHVYVKQIGQHIFTYIINLQLLLSRGTKTLDTLAPSGQRRSYSFLQAEARHYLCFKTKSSKSEQRQIASHLISVVLPHSV